MLFRSVSKWTQVGPGADECATSIVVDDDSIFRVGDGVFIPRTGEVMRIVAVNGSRVATVERGIASQPAALFPNDWAMRLTGS